MLSPSRTLGIVRLPSEVLDSDGLASWRYLFPDDSPVQGAKLSFAYIQDMLLTEIGFEERTLGHQHPVQRFLAWRYVGISTESTCFLIDRGAESRGTEVKMRMQLCASATELLDVLDRLGNVEHSVYWLDTSNGQGQNCRLSSVVALFRYTAGGATWFAFMSQDGTTHPCSANQPDPDDSGWGMVWAAW